MSRLRMGAVVAASILALAAPAVADQVTLNPVRDNSIFSESANSSGAGANLYAGATAALNPRRALLAFDVASGVPAGATITGVQLTLQVNRRGPGSGAADVFALHRLTSDWGEGTSDAGIPGGQGTTATTDDATWPNAFTPSTAWGTAGGDFVAGASATVAFPNLNSTPVTWGSTAQLVADAQAMLDSPGSDFGWIVVGPESSTAAARRFDSREGAIQPQLVIDFDPAVAVVPVAGPIGLVLLTLLLLGSGAFLATRLR